MEKLTLLWTFWVLAIFGDPVPCWWCLCGLICLYCYSRLPAYFHVNLCVPRCACASVPYFLGMHLFSCWVLKGKEMKCIEDLDLQLQHFPKSVRNCVFMSPSSLNSVMAWRHPAWQAGTWAPKQRQTPVTSLTTADNGHCLPCTHSWVCFLWYLDLLVQHCTLTIWFFYQVSCIILKLTM